MTLKLSDSVKDGHELAPLNSRHLNSTKCNNNGVNSNSKGVRIVLPRESIGSRSSNLPQVDGGTAADDRAAWDNKLQFFLSIIGYSVGLGNIWRFPYLCQQNGGGAFLIPFMIMLILEGIPLFLIELGIGQKMRLGSVGVWNNIHPWLGGIGIASCVVTLFVALYYNVIITWCFFYFFNSFQNPLPWSSCPTVNGTTVQECALSSATAYFWYRGTLDASDSIDNPGNFKWWIVICLLISWTIVYFVMMKGIQSSGKVVYFTSLFPYIVLTIFFIRAITLKGAGAGLLHMYKPKVDKLLDPTVWLDAATQVFYSFGLAFGSLIAFGSYNTPKNNCVRDVILVSICNALTAIYASAVIFAILGFKAMVSYDKCVESHNNSTGHVNDYCSLEKELGSAAEGTGLAFIVFTQAIVELPGAPFWAVIFFLMLLALGLGSQIGLLEGMLCTIFDIDFFKKYKKQYVTGVICIFCFFFGLIFTTGAGEYWLKMFDSFAGTIGLVVIAFLEMICVIFIYGHEKFSNDIYEMTGYYPGLYWQVTWRFFSPIVIAAILFSSVIFMVYNNPTYQAWHAELGASVTTLYPSWVMGVAIFMILAGIMPIPLVYLLRRFQCLKMDLDIHQGSIRRIDTTTSTKQMMTDVDMYDNDFDDGMVEFDSDDEDDPALTMTAKSRTFRMKILDY